MSKKLHARVNWKEDMTFEGEIEGNTLTFDGYGLKGASPLEVLLASVGACTAMLVKQALQSMHQDFSRLELELEADKSEEPPEIFKHIHVKVRAVGNVSSVALTKAVDLVEKKYCGATVMIQEGGVNITNSIEVVPK